jgi:hypothetical protein
MSEPTREADVRATVKLLLWAIESAHAEREPHYRWLMPDSERAAMTAYAVALNQDARS